ncbi:hypothetical protein ZIOFF_029092 [Zingiber officinale]|uniref:Trimethylguanosine synthase n=1 Tax=Zingiber officinale TaxID=94328 RepID=A0A8J5GT59_ZINOF|nr:hypothetical protein ZIOFF_029092 [Zingiber officinale]
MADPKKRKRRSQPKKGKLPQSHVILTPSIVSYWHQRYSLFSRFDDGVLMDEEGWYSVTPEAIAASHAERASAYVHCGRSLVLDGFAGVGGNAIQFASRSGLLISQSKKIRSFARRFTDSPFRGCHVVSVDIDPRKVEFAVNNAKIYGVEDRIDFVIGDFFHLAPFLKGDVLFLSPPWGGPSYRHLDNYTLDFLKPKDGCVSFPSSATKRQWYSQGAMQPASVISPPDIDIKFTVPTLRNFVEAEDLQKMRPRVKYSIFQQAQQITPNIIMFLPRNVDVNQVEELSWLSSPPLNFEVKFNILIFF